MSTLNSTFIDQFIVEKMLPRWVEHGWDSTRGLHEGLTPKNEPVLRGFRRLNVVTRQLYTFSRAAEDYADPSFAAMAHRCYEHLISHFQDKRHGGWYFKLDLDGAPLDQSKDFYASSFVVLSLAAYYAAFGKPKDVLSLACETLYTLLEKLNVNDQWLGVTASSDWSKIDHRLHQNPHMHLFEAAIHLHQVSEVGIALDAIELIKPLYETRFLDTTTGCLREFFSDDGFPDKNEGHIAEPGHLFEWHWLLGQKLKDVDVSSSKSELMFKWARQNSYDRIHGGIFDQVDVQGTPLKKTKRIWPVTEALKAYVTALRHEQSDDLYKEFKSVYDLLFKHYMHTDGSWTEHLNEDMSPLQTWMPATTGYHLYLGLTEVSRFLKKA